MPIGRWLVEASAAATAPVPDEQGSIIVVVATDLPLLPHQLKRLAKRAGLGIGRSGSIAGHGSGDIFVAFSTAHADVLAPASTHGYGPRSFLAIPDDALSPVFGAVVEAVDEAILNALTANTTMRGKGGAVVAAMPHDVVQRAMAALPALKAATIG